MKTQLVLGIALSLTLTTAKALAFGPSTGGGGFVVSCPQTPVEPARAQLLDLYEAQEQLGFEIMQTSGSIEQDYFGGVDRTYTLQGQPALAEAIQEDISKNLKRFFRNVKFVTEGSDLPAADDIGQKPVLPSQCRLQQLAYFDDRSETIYILQPLWEQLDSLNQAALVTHEIGFKYYRSLGEKDSRNARVFVAHAYSVKGPSPVNDGIMIPNKDFSLPGKYISQFTVMPGTMVGRSTARLQFQHIAGYAMFSKTWTDIESPVWNLKAKYLNNMHHEVCIVKTPNVNSVTSAPLQGTMFSNHYVTLEYITDQPARLKITDSNGVVVVENYITGCN